MASKSVGLVVGGAALGAISMATYHRFSQPRRPTGMMPVPGPAPPVPVPAGGVPAVPATPVPRGPMPGPHQPRSVEMVEKAREILPFGFPGPVSDTIYRNAYVVSYNRRDRNPNWVAEHLTATSIQRADGVDRKKSQFKEDETVPPMFRARLSDYFRSNFDRGHMVPAADAKISQDAMDETFYLTNISPQVGDGFNRDYWAYFENFCRNLTKSFSDVYVFTGPLYLPHQENDGKFYVKYQVIGNPPNVAVPTHFYKVILTQNNGRYSVGAFVLPNRPISDDTPLEQFKVPLDAVERGAGLTFFDRMDKSGLGDLCKETKCKVVLTKFAEANKKKALSS
ncbi:uncharacterized protein BYT42DRAFT_551637 [Radiomyces spectabilis]|uniref:uncharacterized protein n=1 Tax=Radiomyces spectabilis TaxID=64574 RepID=UPI00221E86AD|nr:uncharacterized protein BYT42DRAFT_551637 [Radiomyces spectabilis]KAI8393607.1 hypothetical protein BYT42DRAFT_551637 [Radiomyces spectabilis]